MLPGEAVVDFAEPQGNARAAEIQIVVVARLGRVAVARDAALLDALIDGHGQAAVAVGHDAHVVVVDRTLADGNVIGLVDPHAGAVMAGVVGPGEFEAFQRAVVGSRVELEDGPGRAAVAAVVEPLPADRDAGFSGPGNGAEGEVLLPHEDGRLVVRLAAGARINEDHVAGLGLGVGLFDPRERLAGANFQGGCGGGIQRHKCNLGQDRKAASGRQRAKKSHGSYS